MKNFKVILISLLVSVFFFGCASLPVKTVKNEGFSLDKYKKIAVVHFKGNNKDAGESLAEMCVPHLMDAGFDVVERSELESILKEQKIELSGAIDNEKMQQIGKLAGVNALVLGSFHYYKKETKTIVTNRRRPLRLLPAVRTTAWERIDSTMKFDNVSIRIVDVETGKVLISSTYKDTVNGEDMDKMFEEVGRSIKEAMTER